MSDDGERFASMTTQQFRARLEHLCERVASEKGRIQVCGGAHTCVLISKDELDTLEQALEILANTSDVRKLAQMISAMAHTVATGPLVVTTRDDTN